jgi:hypothetical protein
MSAVSLVDSSDEGLHVRCRRRCVERYLGARGDASVREQNRTNERTEPSSETNSLEDMYVVATAIGNERLLAALAPAFLSVHWLPMMHCHRAGTLVSPEAGGGASAALPRASRASGTGSLHRLSRLSTHVLAVVSARASTAPTRPMLTLFMQYVQGYLH